MTDPLPEPFPGYDANTAAGLPPDGGMDEIPDRLDHHSPALLHEIRQQTGLASCLLHTGGGCCVLSIDLTIDGRGLGRQAWLTRDTMEEGSWDLGLYDFHGDPEDEGVVVTLHPLAPESPSAVASMVAGVLARVGASLQGEPARLAVEFPVAP